MIIPNDWNMAKFGDLAKITCGVAATPEYVDAAIGVPFLSARNVQNGRLDLSYFQHIPTALHEKLTKNTKPKKGDILLTRVGAGIGEAAVIDIDLEFSVYVSLTLIKCKEGIHSNYIKSLLDTNYYRYLATRDQFAGGGVQNLNVQMVKEYPIPVPPLPEQKKIAQILSTWDKAITTTEQLLANSQQQKKALMQQLLTGKKRLLDENGVRFSGEWEEINLGKSVKVIGGNAFKSEEFKECGIPVVRISNIKPDYSINMDSSIFVSEDSRFNRFKIINGDILIAMSGATTGKIGMYNLNTFSYLNQRVGKFEPIKGRASKNYLFQLFKQPKIQYNVLIDAVGGAQPNISNKDIERIKVLIPALSEQQKIAAVLSTADQEITVLQQKLNALKQEKKALMQQLLTGKRRVKVN